MQMQRANFPEARRACQWAYYHRCIRLFDFCYMHNGGFLFDSWFYNWVAFWHIFTKFESVCTEYLNMLIDLIHNVN